MTLLEQLDAALPTWRREYDNDPLAAAVDLGLIDEDEAEAETCALDFHDDAANWRRVAEFTAEQREYQSPPGPGWGWDDGSMEDAE